jgi:hypothetical protein
MKLAVACAAGVAALLAPGFVLAQQRTGINNEVVCAGPGSGMDPRCVGETYPGTWSDYVGSDQSRPYVIVPRPFPFRR